MGCVPYQYQQNSQCCPIVYPYSASFFIFHSVCSTLFKHPILYSGDIMPTSQKCHYHHHLPPYLNLQPFFCLIYPYICIYTFLSHWEIFNSGLILILIPLPVLRPMASHAQGPPSVKIVPSHMINLSLSCEVTLSRLLCSCFACFVPYHHGTSLYTRLPEPDSWTF